MSKAIWYVATVAGAATFIAGAGRAEVPAPPVNQTIGMRDVWFISLTEAGCRACHNSGVPNRHHVLYGKPIPSGIKVPYPDADGNGIADGIYSCMSCHGRTFALVRDCLVCHTGGSSPHHAPGGAAWGGDCKSCHGSIVDNRGDGHYIPSYSPSLVTPTPTRGDGLPPNSRGNGAGACDYCHDSDGLATPIIRFNLDLHHGTGLLYGYNHCDWCHDFAAPLEAKIRACENCHGPRSLHNIQADSPAPGNVGTIVVGGEFAGYGHIGRDAGPGDSDCWGCHGFAMSFAPNSGPVIPTVYGADKATVRAGAATSVVLTGAAFTNTMGNAVYDAVVTLTAANGASVTLTPDVIVDQGSLAVTIPAGTKPGNYGIRAKKADFLSNPAAVSVIPKVWIVKATAALDKTVTITGGGFAGYTAGSGLFVNGPTSTGKIVKGTVVSWSPGKIVAKFGTVPTKVTVCSVFGKASHAVVIP